MQDMFIVINEQNYIKLMAVQFDFSLINILGTFFYFSKWDNNRPR